MIMAESALEGTGYRMVLLAPEEEFVPSFLDFAGLSLLFMILFVVVASWLTYLLIVARLRGLETLRGMLQDIAQGEGDLTKRLVANRTDEIGELAEGFNQTLDTFSHLVGIIKVQAHKLSGLGGDLASNMTQTAAAITEVIATIQSVKNQVLRQAASVEQTSQTTGAITSSIEDLNARIEQQSSNVTQSSAAIEEMLSSIQSVTGTLVKNSAAIQNLTSLSEQGREALEAMASDIKIVALDSDSLLEISQVIHDIASQTNLLSMNAAIEAAHAGESGKGFAVVAEEIRKLAETSGEESKKIAAVLAKIKTSVDGITAATGEVQTQFEHIYSEVKTVSHQESMIKNAMEEQNAGSQEVYTAISELTDITESVKDRSRDMLQGSTEVTRESKNLKTITEEITHSMNEMSQGVQEITQAVSFVDEMTRENQGSIDALLAEIGRFKIEE
ncbi:hypothetical protein AU468_04305 [Alkalispirochaeta sphaeroplastigenens]|uniref:Chemotaxis protein n=2 Tax=Alkalispirochaeta sphaeroplastigenens TaxID=1187066 RepID=A0A2S4JWZ3_9SPIO|nr:hypothetical protein AU468_04305 [Alkalispirochaeta sphaeroplastigenens]